MKEATIKHIQTTLLDKVCHDPSRRNEALGDFLSIAMPVLKKSLSENSFPEHSVQSKQSVQSDLANKNNFAEAVPEVPDELYLKWINLFIESLFSSLSPEQIEDITDGSPNNNASLALVYLMFMESERMEKEVEKDLKEWGNNA